MSYISVGLRLLLSIAFLGAGGSKLAGVEMMVMTFDQIGWGQGFRYVTGAIEVIGVVLLWLPRRQVIGAAVLGGTMVVYDYCILLYYKITIFTIDQEKANAKASSSTAIRRFERIEWT